MPRGTDTSNEHMPGIAAVVCGGCDPRPIVFGGSWALGRATLVTMGGTIVGRDAVLDEAWTALQKRRAVLLAGPAGIGKTAVLRELVDRARAEGYLVVGCAPTEAETALPLAAVADLLQALRDRAHVLPEPQRIAVDAALLLGASDVTLDERALGAATRALLDDAAERNGGRLIVAVDDAPWLDPPSERALRFVLRRLTDVAVLVGSRIGPDDPAPLGLDTTPERLTRISLNPLGAGPLHHLIAAHFDVSLSRPLLARVAHESGGNPLLAIELARAILRLPVPLAPGDDLPVAASMQDLVAATLSGLPPPSRDAVRLAALLSTPQLPDLVAAGADPTDLDPAEEAGLVSVGADDRVRFAHPVHASAVRAAIPAGTRRRLHAALAAVVTDPDERARQLARATTTADAHVADEIDSAAARARARGAAEVAAGFYDRAAELTPPTDPDARHARRLTAVHCRFDSGDYTSAGAQAEAIAAELSGDARADALLLRASIAWSADAVADATSAAREALTAATADTPLAGRIHAHLAVFVVDPAIAAEHAVAARRLLVPSREAGPSHRGVLGQDDRATLASALMLLFFNEVRSGQGVRMELLDEALLLEGDDPSWLAGTVPAIFWKAIDDHERARVRLTWMYERAVSLGDEPFQHELMTHLGETELFACRYDAARRWIRDARDLGEQLASGLIAENWLAGMVAAGVGDLDVAGEAAAEGLRLADETDDWWRRRINLLLAGNVALARGRFADAAARYAELADAVDATGLIEPLANRFEADWVEACVGAGDLAVAERAYARLRRRHEHLPRPWTALGLARSDVLMAATAGRPVEEQLAALSAARDAVPADIVPVERARCLLVAGSVHRRSRRKKQAKDALDQALAEFDALGARALADRTRAELARIGGRPPAPLQLTATEERVARLAAEGRTNRAIADALFVSPKTVEANLARVYRKLGITTRAELGAVMATRDR